MKKSLLVFGALVIIAAAVVGLSLLHANSTALNAAAPIAASNAAVPLKPHRDAPAGSHEYYDPKLGISFFFPSDLTEHEYHDGSATTLTFQNTTTVKGFQIFAAPYDGARISEARFRMDEPSGVRRSPMEITIDGVQAVSFYGYDPRLGDTAEIWFIRDGYLFEVTTLKPDVAWLSTIMNTWEFLH